MITEYRKYFYKKIYDLFYSQLNKIAIEFNLDINELDAEYLNYLKEYC